ncbi:MAG TPA: GNAT family N-acetyltransferase [Pyrinomonadaceae bacterium]|nr:GNAT family N-acetyltransferase [Pyrinomonadaceae bacterium]
MYSSLSKTEAGNSLPPASCSPYMLSNEEAKVVLNFLPKKPAHSAYLAGLIEENGLVSPLNRGMFYASRNFLAEIQGVALVGHATIIEPTNKESLRELAEVAGNCDSTHLVMCEERWADEFWKHYRTINDAPKLENREFLLELRWPTIHSNQPRPQLRLATINDLELLVPVHAGLATAESGVDPRDMDNEGFIQRYQKRICKGRTWVLTEGDHLIFKADVVTATDETCYVEGVWVNSSARRRGYGQACIAELARMLLWRSRSLSLMVNENNKDAQVFYRSCGFQVRGSYRTAFLH